MSVDSTARKETSDPTSSKTVAPTLGAMTINDFCEWAGIGRSLTYRLIAGGQLKAVKVGKRRLIRRADAQVWLNGLQ
jgi:excisionase family DNA binding protein